MRPFYISLLIGAGLFLSGCVRDVNLAKDVDLLVPSTSPSTNQMQQQRPPQARDQQTNEMQQQYNQDPGANMNMNNPQPTNIPQQQPTEPATVNNVQKDILVDLNTSKGVIRLKLYPAEAPKTVQNFLNKASSNYYKGLKFHRVEDWVIQGGDPLGNGTGGGKLATELSQTPFKAGSLGVARGGDINVSNDSQFFICTTDCSWLTGQYTNFGEVVTGMDIVTKIAIGDTIDSIVEVK